MKQSKKKKRSRASSGKGNAANEKEKASLEILVEAFAGVSMEEAASAWREANRDPNKAAEILASTMAMEDRSATFSSSNGTFDVGSSSSSSSSSNGTFDVGSSSSSNGTFDVGSSSTSNGTNELGSSSSSNASMLSGDGNDLLQDGVKQKGKPKCKKVVASAGSVSAVLGRDYVRSNPKKGSTKLKDSHEESWREEAAQFIFSMLGDDSELGFAIVRDVLCQCGYNVDKALDVLLELSASSKEQASGYYKSTRKEVTQHIVKSNNNLFDKKFGSASNSSNIELQENVWFTGNLRNLSRSNDSHNSKTVGNLVSELPQEVLESLFNMPTPKSAEHEPTAMDWRRVVKQMTSLGPKSEPTNNQQLPLSHAKGDDYLVHRETARQHWESMKSYYQRAVTAFTNGEKQHAAYLSEQGRVQNKLAQEADQRASQDIFASRNKSIENMITIDLHGQHVKPAMKLMKLHLLFGAYVRSVQSFRVITGCGSHGLGKSKLKNAVVDLLQREGIAWSEENRGTLLIRLDGHRDFSFLNSGSDSD